MTAALALLLLLPAIWSSILTFSPTVWLHGVAALPAALAVVVVTRLARRDGELTSLFGMPRRVGLVAAIGYLIAWACNLGVLVVRGHAWPIGALIAGGTLPLAVLSYCVGFSEARSHVIATVERGDAAPDAAPAPPVRPVAPLLTTALVVLLVLAALLPNLSAEVIGRHLEGAVADDAAREVARQLVTLTRGLDVREATALLAHAPLGGGQRAVLRLPSGTTIPENANEIVDDVVNATGRAQFVERPLEGALRGGTIRIYYGAPSGLRAVPMTWWGSTLLLCAAALLLAGRLGRALRDDVALLDASIRAIAAEQPRPPGELELTESRRLDRALRRLIDRLPRLTVEAYLSVEKAEDARRFKSKFLAMMSHDLRSPLNSILGFTELLLRGLEGSIQPGQEVVLAAMHGTGQNLLRLLNEILESAKLDSGKMEVARQSTPPAELVTNATREARRGRSAAAGERVQVEMQAGMATISVDPLRLTQALTHLLNAALDGDGDGSIAVGVTLKEMRDNPAGDRAFTIEMTFRDSYAAQHGKAAFDGFRKVVGRSGLNLALPLARRLIDLHNGTIDVVAKKPPEVTYRITIPVGPPPRRRPPQA